MREYNILMRIFFYLLFILPLGLSAQQSGQIQTMKNELQTMNAGREKVNAYQRLITEVQGQDPRLSAKLIQELFHLSQKIGSQEGIAWANYQQAFYYNMTGNYDSLKIYADRCLQVSKQNQLLKSEASGHQMVATYYWQTGMFDEAVKNHFKALRIREKLKDSAGIGSSLASLGAVSLSTNKLAQAKKYVARSLEIARRLKDDKLILRNLHTLANVYGTEGSYQKALNVDKEALVICEKLDNRRNFSEIYSNMALCFFYMGDYNSSLKYHYEVLEIDRFFKDEKQIGDTYLNLASVYIAKKDYPKAEELLNNSLDLFRKTDYKYGMRNTYESLGKVYETRGEYKKALAASHEYLKLANQISNENNDKNIARLNVQYETEKKEQQIEALNQRSVIQNLEIDRRNIIIAIIAGALLAGGLLVYLLSNRRKLIESHRMQEFINEQQKLSARAIFEAEEEERRRLAADLHDGVGQVLSCALMNLNGLFKNLTLMPADAAVAERSLSLVNESYDEMRSISHRMMPHALSKKGINQALRQFADKIDNRQLNVHLDLQELDRRLDAMAETALYRAIQESVNNVIKHAGASNIYISMISDHEGVSVTIEDDGRGFDPVKIEDSTGIGLRNIRSRIEFLKGTVEIDSKPKKGALIIIQLPL